MNFIKLHRASDGKSELVNLNISSFNILYTDKTCCWTNGKEDFFPKESIQEIEQLIKEKFKRQLPNKVKKFFDYIINETKSDNIFWKMKDDNSIICCCDELSISIKNGFSHSMAVFILEITNKQSQNFCTTITNDWVEFDLFSEIFNKVVDEQFEYIINQKDQNSDL